MCTEVIGRGDERMERGKQQSGSYKELRMWLAYVKRVWFVNWHFTKVSPLPSPRGWEMDPVFKCWLEQSVNPFGSCALSQAGSLRGADVLGMWP